MFILPILLLIGVFLFLKGNLVMNNSIVFFTEIGETYNYSDTYSYSRILLMQPTSLQCITDKIPCCLQWPGRDGWWYSSDGSEVYYNYGQSLYRDRANDGSVNLNRHDGAMSPNAVGLYCCRLSDAQRTYHTLCANIGMQCMNTS